MLMTMSNKGFSAFKRDVSLNVFVHSHTICKFQEDLIKTMGGADDKHFPIVSLWDLVVAIASKIFIGFPIFARGYIL